MTMCLKLSSVQCQYVSFNSTKGKYSAVKNIQYLFYLFYLFYLLELLTFSVSCEDYQHILLSSLYGMVVEQDSRNDIQTIAKKTKTNTKLNFNSLPINQNWSYKNETSIETNLKALIQILTIPKIICNLQKHSCRPPKSLSPFSEQCEKI